MSSKPARGQPRNSKTSSRPKRRSPSLFAAPTPSERAFEAALEALKAGASGAAEATVPSGHVDSERDAFVERVFARRDEYLRDPYARIGDASAFHSKIVGVTFEGRQDTIAGLPAGVELILERQPDNISDVNAIAVRYGSLQIGFLRRGIAAHLAPAIDDGAVYRARVASLTGGGQQSRGVNVFVERDPGASIAARDRPRESARRTWDGDAERIRSALIGDSQPHAAQRAVLERIAGGANTLAVLGTGRGKSFCFQLPAALRALTAGQKTLVVYPLRALANDQYEGMLRTLDPLGVRVFRANGSIDNRQRDELFEALREGAWDLVLATPEFLDFHRAQFTGRSRPALVVVDEAHHVHESHHRPAYARLAAAVAALGNPQILALTATAGDDAFGRIVEDLAITAWVIDPTVRENLHVVDARNHRDKAAYLRQVFAGEGKGIVYCNSRKEASDVAAALRGVLGAEIAFYHAGMPTKERHEVERFFREGGLRVVVATSAFGEGIDLPDVRDVVLYHLNFDFAEFNQQAGRAGRDGAAANIHLLYGENDRRINEYLIDLDAPLLTTLRQIYREMRKLGREGIVRTNNAEIADALAIDRVRDRTISAALRIFSDARLVAISEDDDGRIVRFLPPSGKIEMERNERFAEGEATREAFRRFCDLALTAAPESLEQIVNRPLYPSRVEHRR